MIELVATDLDSLVKEINISIAKGLVIKKIDISVDDREFNSHKAIIDQYNFIDLPKEEVKQVKKHFQSFTEFKAYHSYTDKYIGDKIYVSFTRIRDFRLGNIKNNKIILLDFMNEFDLSKEQVETMIKGEQMLYVKK